MSSEIVVGDVLEVLRGFPSNFVQTIVTSPPYWGLRSYLPKNHPEKPKEIGAEKTPQEYVEKLVTIFREARRVLREDGTLWLNLGDTYAANRSYQVNSTKGGVKHSPAQGFDGSEMVVPAGMKPKDLVGIPWAVAFALRTDGWYLRRDIIWSKPNPMPESVTDRPSTAHEYVFLFSKNEKYYYDSEAVRETAAQPERKRRDKFGGNKGDEIHHSPGSVFEGSPRRNLRSVWEITTQPFPGAHFATFPEKLVEPCVRAGSSEGGCCAVCSAPRERVVEKGFKIPDRPGRKQIIEDGNLLHDGPDGRAGSRWRTASFEEASNYYAENPGDAGAEEFRAVAWQRAECGADLSGGYSGESTKNHSDNGVQDASAVKARVLAGMVPKRTIAWGVTCAHAEENAVSCLVMDPFCGSGTVGVVAQREGRDFIGIELSANYVEMARQRIGDPDYAKKIRAAKKSTMSPTS